MSDPRPARHKRVASANGDEATYYVEEHETGWRVTYDDAPIGILKDAGDATRFACDIARMQAQIGRVTWVIVLAEVEEVHRFETQARSPRQSAKVRRLMRAAPTSPYRAWKRLTYETPPTS